MSGDVPNALLRRVAERGRAAFAIFLVVATRRNFARAAVFIFGGNFFCADHGPNARARRVGGTGCANNHFARRGNSWAGAFISVAGMVAGGDQGAVDGFISRGYFEHDWRFDDVDGRDLLDGGNYFRVIERESLRVAHLEYFSSCGGGHDDLSDFADDLDDVASRDFCRGSWDVHPMEWMFLTSAGVVVSNFPVERAGIRRTRRRIYFADEMGARARRTNCGTTYSWRRCDWLVRLVAG